jgi:hypothetical protein
MQARRGFVLFSIGKPATGVGLIEMGLLKINGLVIKRRDDNQYTKKSWFSITIRQSGSPAKK